MSLGVYNTYVGTVNQGDTVAIQPTLEINGQTVTADQIKAVVFTIQTPAIEATTGNTTYTLPVTEIEFQPLAQTPPSSGMVYIQDNFGLEPFSYTGLSGNTITGVTGGTAGAVFQQSYASFLSSTTQNGIVQPDGSGFLLWPNTQIVGPYLSSCQFQLMNGEKRSVLTSFNVIDPFNPPIPTPVEKITEQVWLRLEDIFDSTEGGPWLRDRTLANFDQEKIGVFIPEALFDINIQMPPTNYTIDMFTAGDDNANMPLLIKGTLILTIRHLMRSYTEIATPTGQGQLVWADRTRYQQAWGQIYSIEYQDYIAAIRLFKRTYYQFGRSALLTFSKAGRIWPYSGYQSRGIIRGYL